MSLKTKAVPYRAGARYCDTCLSEKTHIALANPNEVLNSRKEIVGKCPHKREFKLKFYKPPWIHHLTRGTPKELFFKPPFATNSITNTPSLI